MWPIEALRPYSDNPRKISEHAIQKVAESLTSFGWRQPIVIDETGTDRMTASFEYAGPAAPAEQAVNFGLAASTQAI